VKKIFDILFPLIVAILLLRFWQWRVRHDAIPVYVLPAPSDIAGAFVDNFSSLMGSLLATLRGDGGGLHRRADCRRRGGDPVQPEPVVDARAVSLCGDFAGDAGGAIAPLILIWVGFERVNTALVLIAALVAFFPILSNTTLGLKSADFNLIDLARLYNASRWQILRRVQLPSALPYLLTGMKIAGGLALIGAVVASSWQAAVAPRDWRGASSKPANRLQIATMFAALALLAALGVAIFAALSGLEYFLLRRWHESALKHQS